MYIKIFQIMPKRNFGDFAFGDLNKISYVPNVNNVKAEIYQEVFSGDVDSDDLGEVYRKFNQEMHPLFRGRNMSPSDAVAVGGEVYYCKKEGFCKIDFDVSKTHKQDNLIKIVYVEPNRKPFVSEIENTLEAEQKAVGGLIELIGNGDGTFLVTNDESKLIGMEGNRRLKNGAIIAGPFFVVGDDGENFRSLTDEEIEKYTHIFSNFEKISLDEVAADMDYFVFSF